jgi:hypothetical protein
MQMPTSHLPKYVVQQLVFVHTLHLLLICVACFNDVACRCYARAMVGQLYALCPALVLEDKQKLEDAHHHTKLSVRFHGDCLHKVDGPSFGRLDGARREAVRELLQGECLGAAIYCMLSILLLVR